MEPRKVQIDRGAVVYASDERLGVVDEIVVKPENEHLAYLVVRPDTGGADVTVPVDVITSVPSAREVRLAAQPTRATGSSALGATSERGLLIREVGGALHVPIVEERLNVQTRPVELGELLIHKRVETTEAVSQVAVRHDEVEIERVARHEVLNEPREPRHEGEWLVIPVMKEVLVVEKRLVLTEEIRVRRRDVHATREVRETVRREIVELEDTTPDGQLKLRGGDGLSVRRRTT